MKKEKIIHIGFDLGISDISAIILYRSIGKGKVEIINVDTNEKNTIDTISFDAYDDCLYSLIKPIKLKLKRKLKDFYEQPHENNYCSTHGCNNSVKGNKYNTCKLCRKKGLY